MQSRRMVLPALLAMLSLVVLPIAAETHDEGGDQATASSFQQELIQVQKALWDAWQRGDAEYIRNAIADNFVAIETNGGTTGKSDFMPDIQPSTHPKPSTILYDFEVLQLDETCAVVTYNAVFSDKQLDRYQHLSDSWVKQGGRWKLKFQQSTLNLWSAHDLD
jgi:hypothetical protein